MTCISPGALRAEEKATFAARGLVRLPGFLPAERVERARRAVRERLERAAEPRVGRRLVVELKKRWEIANLLGDETRQVVAALLDGGAAFALGDAQVLFTWPDAAAWSVPRHAWHVDLPRLPGADVPGVQVFTFLDTVVPGGGGTLVVAGSHRLVNEQKRLRSQQVKKRLQREPYFQRLMAHDEGDRAHLLATPGSVGDVELQVVELHGEPGDLYCADLRLLHTLAPNAASAPRVMLTQRFVLESLRDVLYSQGEGVVQAE